jgi:hypothetical protein
MRAAADADLASGTAVVLFGLDEKRKPHASAFPAELADQAENAARLMGMRVLRLDTDEQRALAATLPQGRVFESGRAFVPFVKRPLYESLSALGGAPLGDQPGGPEGACTGSPEGAGGKPGGEAGPKLPVTLDELEIGTLVLACQTPGEGWFEAVVVRIDGDELVTLKWRDWPKWPIFARRRWQLALLPQERPTA